MADKITTDHEEIKKWASVYEGTPQVLEDATIPDEPVGLRIDFPGDQDDQELGNAHKPKTISWEEFFTCFEKLGLAFMYTPQDHTDDPSELYRFIPRANLTNEVVE